ncbi:unnamed protein product [Brassica rapa subsp. narinosa]
MSMQIHHRVSSVVYQRTLRHIMYLRTQPELFEDFEANCGRSNLSVRTYFASKISDVVQLISVQYVTERPVLHGAGVATIERVLVYFQPKE